MKLPSRRASPLPAETTALRAVVRTPDWFWSALSIILLACLAAYFFLTSPTDGDFWWFDSSRHAMNGVFLLDLLRDLLLDGGLRHPMQFARDYYQQYLAINVGLYPPFFYLSSVPFLALFGSTHAVSQFVVTLYAFAAGVLSYLIARRCMDGLSSVAVAIAISMLPCMALWTRQVQLDVPAVAALLAVAYSLIRHLDTERRVWLVATGVCLGIAISVRLQTVYALPVVLYFLFLTRHGQRAPWRARLFAMMLAAGIATPALLMQAYFGGINRTQAMHTPGTPLLWSIQNWT